MMQVVVFIFSEEHAPVIKRLNNEMKSQIQCLCKTCDIKINKPALLTVCAQSCRSPRPPLKLG